MSTDEKRSPVLGEETIGRICSRRLNAPGEPEVICGKDARFHVFWDVVSMENSFSCLDHAREATEDFDAQAWHQLDACCGMPGSWYSSEHNYCYYPDDELPVAEAQSAQAMAVS